jgi:hypothetical protein
LLLSLKLSPEGSIWESMAENQQDEDGLDDDKVAHIEQLLDQAAGIASSKK